MIHDSGQKSALDDWFNSLSFGRTMILPSLLQSQAAHQWKEVGPTIKYLHCRIKKKSWKIFSFTSFFTNINLFGSKWFSKFSKLSDQTRNLGFSTWDLKYSIALYIYSIVKFSKSADFLTFFLSRSSPTISVYLLLLNAIETTFESLIIFLLLKFRGWTGFLQKVFLK